MGTVVFIHGAGEGAYEADEPLVAALREALGPSYEVRYPEMPADDGAGYEGWTARIASALPAQGEAVMLVGHSVGGSVLLRYLCEESLTVPVAGLFVLAAPFWGADDFWEWDEARLPGDAAQRLVVPKVFLYHDRDDESVPFSHLGLYAERLPQATVRPLDAGGHQFDHGLQEVARDILGLAG